jgi:cyclopropane-fatty-acyl-phospholipid synthase
MTATTLSDIQAPAHAPRGFGLFLRLLAANWTWGRLTLKLPDGAMHELVGKVQGRSAVLEIRDYNVARRVLANGDIGFAEGYMADEWDSPDLAVLLEVLVENYDHIHRLFNGSLPMKVINWISHRLRRNSRRGARKNIHAHYDLGNEFYASWLDETMTYSSARYAAKDEALAVAQARKYESLARRMDLKAGQSVLEIGCGWGGFAEYAAREVGAKVTAITISQEQYDFARQRTQRAGLGEQVSIQLVDYRDVTGQFDRVASIEMFEAVGQEYWPTYFGKIAEVLAPGGRAALQIITIQDALFEEYAVRTDFIQKYIFPGGMLPSEARLKPVIEAAGLSWQSVERFGQDYADTLAAWDRRFQSSWSDIQRLQGFDERFRRMWRFYLGYCEAGFRSGRTDVIQLAIGKD